MGRRRQAGDKRRKGGSKKRKQRSLSEKKILLERPARRAKRKGKTRGESAGRLTAGVAEGGRLGDSRPETSAKEKRDQNFSAERGYSAEASDSIGKGKNENGSIFQLNEEKTKGGG